jgi:two-component system chemotaxis response regulator CheY
MIGPINLRRPLKKEEGFMKPEINMNMKVLVVDDFATMRKIVRNILKQIGFTNIVEADDGAHALEMIKEDKIDFVVTDWNMPNMTGLDLLKNIRATERAKDTPVLMVTAEGLADNVVDAVKAGVDNYIVKPFTAETVQAKIEQIFAKRSAKA